jgi:pimeloyl-ACP methyl ester carboxylesterase
VRAIFDGPTIAASAVSNGSAFVDSLTRLVSVPSSATTGESTLSRTTCPVHFWHSDDDKNGPLLAIEQLTAEIPGASLRVWNGEGHSAPARHLNDILHDLIDAADGER